MENTLERIRELLDIRSKADAELKTIQTRINAELTALKGGTSEISGRKQPKCGICAKEGHTARTCPQKAGPQAPAAKN
jgi:hypothetical protein